MTYQEYGELVGKSPSLISNAIHSPKGQVKAKIANQLAIGGFLTPYEWKYLTPQQKVRRWKKWKEKLDDEALEVPELQQGAS